MKMAELKPCPFCGGKAELYSCEAEHDIYDSKTLEYVETEYYTKYGCACTSCDCTIAEMLSEQNVIEAWNRRADNADD
jgi:Lar family restriction alleviation protein